MRVGVTTEQQASLFAPPPSEKEAQRHGNAGLHERSMFKFRKAPALINILHF